MKTTLSLLLILFIVCQATGQILNIPDSVFKQALLGHGLNTGVEIDTNFDGEIQVSESAALTGILDVNGQFIDIHDLTGIEAFVNITDLQVWLNQLTSLNLSNNTALKNLDCAANPLSFLNVSHCTVLEEIRSNNTALNALDVTNNPLLTLLNVSQSQIVSLDLRQNPELGYINCVDNHLTLLDIRNGNSNNVTVFGAHGNPDLICIFVDDAEYYETNFAGNIDPQSAFVEMQAECDALGLNEHRVRDIKIYPNPAKDRLFIEDNIGMENQKRDLILMDVLGKMIFKTQLPQRETTTDISHLQPGIYFLTIYGQTKEILTKKIIKL